MKLIFLGAPGAGKGTQAEIVSEKYSIPAISTGSIIREAIKNKTEMGLAAQAYTDGGKLVPDEVVVGIVDSGIDYNHEMFENRIVRSYSNSSPDGDSNDEMDIEALPHGTMVASVIVDNSPYVLIMPCF